MNKWTPPEGYDPNSWGKKGQVLYPGDHNGINWETFSDIHPRYDYNWDKAEKAGLTPCLHCGKGIKDLSKSYVATLGRTTHYHRLFLPNDAPERDKVRTQAFEVNLGPECATNLPSTHRRKYKG
jgi:hypothetical protein